MDPDPIKQLQSLFTDRSKLLETISSIHSALDSVKSPSVASTTEVNEAAADPALTIPNPDDPIYSRLVQALRDMQAQIDERIRPLAQELVQDEMVRLRGQSDDQQNALQECLARIDQSILDCLTRMDEYQCRCADLTTINNRLSELGAAPEPLPPEIPTDNLADVIAARLDNLRREGKL